MKIEPSLNSLQLTAALTETIPKGSAINRENGLAEQAIDLIKYAIHNEAAKPFPPLDEAFDSVALDPLSQCLLQLRKLNQEQRSSVKEQQSSQALQAQAARSQEIDSSKQSNLRSLIGGLCSQALNFASSALQLSGAAKQLAAMEKTGLGSQASQLLEKTTQAVELLKSKAALVEKLAGTVDTLSNAINGQEAIQAKIFGNNAANLETAEQESAELQNFIRDSEMQIRDIFQSIQSTRHQAQMAIWQR